MGYEPAPDFCPRHRDVCVEPTLPCELCAGDEHAGYDANPTPTTEEPIQ